MRTKIVGAVLTAAAIALPQAVQAEGLVRLRVGAASTNYDLTFDNVGVYANMKAKSKYTAKSAGLTLISEGGFYVDVLGQTSGDATHDLWKPAPDQKFSRDDFTVTLGVSIPGQSGTGSVFGGYKSGSTELTARPGLPWKRDTFDSDGFFFGAGYGFPAAGGQIGFNGAIAFMQGTWTDDTGYNNEADFTVGFSLGLSYTYMFGKNFGIVGDIKTQRYSYDFAVYSTTQPAYTVVEQINSVGLSLFAQF
jgi:hypothetical protein